LPLIVAKKAKFKLFLFLFAKYLECSLTTLLVAMRVGLSVDEADKLGKLSENIPMT